MFYRISTSIRPMSKPRGKQAKDGHIYHSSKDYTDYKKVLIAAFDELIYDHHKNYVNPIGLALVHAFIPSNNDRDRDGDNLIGAVADSLVEFGLVKQDSERYIQDWLVKAIPIKYGEEEIIIYIWNPDPFFLVDTDILALMKEDAARIVSEQLDKEIKAKFITK